MRLVVLNIEISKWIFIIGCKIFYCGWRYRWRDNEYT